MNRITRMEIMTLTSVKDIAGNEYQDDWRTECIGGQGLVVFEELVRKIITRESLKFYYTKDGVFIDDLQTSYGKIVLENENELVFRTRNSTYIFEFKHNLSKSVVEAFMRFGIEEKEKLDLKEVEKKESLNTLGIN